MHPPSFWHPKSPSNNGISVAQVTNPREQPIRAAAGMELPPLSGRIAVQSQIGIGSTFTLTLPIRGLR